MVLALAFRGLRPSAWEPVEHLQPRSEGFEAALEAAEADLRARRADGRLTLDASPRATTFWVDDVVDGVAHRTDGLVVGLRVDASDGDAVLAHERTFPGPVRRRVVTRNRLGVEPTPTLVVLREPVPGLGHLLDEARRTADVPLTADVGRGRHHAVPCDLPDDVAHALRGVPALVADGHHRIAAASDPAARDRGTILAWLVAADRGPRLRPVHRTVAALPPDAHDRLRAAGVHLDPAPARPDPEAPVLVTGDGAWRMSAVGDGDVAASLDRMHATVRGLPVALVQVVLQDVLGIGTRRDQMGTGTDAARAIAAVADGTVEAAVLACGPDLAAVWRAAEAGVLLPPKATWFAPKPHPGAVLRPLADTDQEGRA